MPEKQRSRRVFLASTSQHKLTEYRAIFAGSPVAILSPEGCAGGLRVAETGATFLENARLKAVAYARACREWVLADDSGLQVDALQGRPGVYSNRFAGPEADDSERNRTLLSILHALPDPNRGARYRCAIAIAAPDGVIAFTTDATCEGRIGRVPRGAEGFGYDPIFLLPDGRRSMAELTPHEKNRISHRGQAGRAARRFLEAILSNNKPDP